MTEDDKRNEHFKLIANWTNTLATTVIGAGTFVPAAQAFFHILPDKVDFGDLVALGSVCVAVGLGIHCIGQIVLGAFLR